MSGVPSKKTTIRIDLNNNRLCIAKDTLYAMGSPDHIQILISSDRNMMYIKSCETKVKDSFLVPPRVYADPDYSYHLKRAAFAEAIRIATGWDDRGSYRLYGTLISPSVMEFTFAQAEQLSRNSSANLVSSA